LKVREIAVEAGVTVVHVYNLVRAQRLPGSHKVNGEWVIPEETAQSYLERRRKGRGKSILPPAGAVA
jgi:predicted site-specific integrase-resolvase